MGRSLQHQPIDLLHNGYDVFSVHKQPGLPIQTHQAAGAVVLVEGELDGLVIAGVPVEDEADLRGTLGG